MAFVRCLGKNERILTKLNEISCTWNIIIVSRIRGLLDEKTLSQAFDLVRVKHPILNCRIVKSSKNLCFEKIDSIPKVPLHVVRNFRGCVWEGIVQQELNLKIDHQKCLLRAVVVYPSDEQDITYLITSLHHAVSDGQSSMHLHYEILTYCQQIENGLPIFSDSINNSLPILPPVEIFLPQWTKKFKGLLNSQVYLLRLVLEKIWHRPKTLKFEKYLPIESRHCNLIHRQLNTSLTEALITLSKREKTTVHAALCAAMILSVTRKVNPDTNKKVCISCKSSVNLRKRLSSIIDDSQMGAFASLLMSYITVRSNTLFWDLARSVKKQTEVSLKRKDDLKMLLSSEFLFHYLLRFPREIASTVHISNVGRVNIPQVYGSYKLEEISFSTSNRFYGGIFTVEVTTFQNQMFLNFVFVEPLISRNTMEELVNDFILQITEVCWGIVK